MNPRTWPTATSFFTDADLELILTGLSPNMSFDAGKTISKSRTRCNPGVCVCVCVW